MGWIRLKTKDKTTTAPATKLIGDWGESRAEEYLRANGFKILHRNWRSGRYELDIVAQLGDIIHFVEVKCRRADGLTTPAEAITENKSEALFTAAEAYIEHYDLEQELQFDLIAVEYRESGEFELQHIENAIFPRW